MALPLDSTRDDRKALSAADAKKLKAMLARAAKPIDAKRVARVVLVPLVRAFVEVELTDEAGKVKMTAPVIKPGEVNVTVDGDTETYDVHPDRWKTFMAEAKKRKATVEVLSEPEVLEPSVPYTEVVNFELSPEEV